MCSKVMSQLLVMPAICVQVLKKSSAPQDQAQQIVQLKLFCCARTRGTYLSSQAVHKVQACRLQAQVLHICFPIKQPNQLKSICILLPRATTLPTLDCMAGTTVGLLRLLQAHTKSSASPGLVIQKARPASGRPRLWPTLHCDNAKISLSTP